MLFPSLPRQYVIIFDVIFFSASLLLRRSDISFDAARPCQFVALSPLGCASQPIAVLKLSGLHYVGRRPGIITYGPQLSGPFSSLSYLEDGGTWCAGLLAEKG